MAAQANDNVILNTWSKVASGLRIYYLALIPGLFCAFLFRQMTLMADAHAAVMAQAAAACETALKAGAGSEACARLPDLLPQFEGMVTLSWTVAVLMICCDIGLILGLASYSKLPDETGSRGMAQGAFFAAIALLATHVLTLMVSMGMVGDAGWLQPGGLLAFLNPLVVVAYFVLLMMSFRGLSGTFGADFLGRSANVTIVVAVLYLSLRLSTALLTTLSPDVVAWLQRADLLVELIVVVSLAIAVNEARQALRPLRIT